MRDRAPPSGVEGRALVVSPRSQKAFKIQKAKTPITWPSDTLHVHLPVGQLITMPLQQLT